MKYFLINPNSNEDVLLKYHNLCINIKKIAEHKSDIIYKASIPRLKQTQYRGIQAFKQLLKKINDDEKISYDNDFKNEWMKYFKLLYKYEAFPTIINGTKCILFNDNITTNTINELISIHDYELINEEPKLNFDVNKKDMIKICKEFIIAHELNRDDIIQLFLTLLN